MSKDDWIIDLGPGVEDGTQSHRGDKGDEIVAEGTPEQVAKEPRSYTGHYLAPLLAKSVRSELAEGSTPVLEPKRKTRRSSSVRQQQAAE